MQFMWLSGPTGTVRTFSITFRTVASAATVLAFALMFIGFLLHFVGFKIAVEYNPDLARSIGGVTSEAEQRRMEATYRENLDQLRMSLQSTINEIRQLETMKNRFMEMATPTGLREKMYRGRDESKGGPFIAPRPFSSVFRLPLDKEFDQSQSEFKQTTEAVQELKGRWTDQLDWLLALPTGIPINGEFRVSSGFGIRNDPFTGHLAMHEGLDFTASTGTPILATAPGTVTRSGWDHGYGNVVEVVHADGFATRYAHMSARIVKEGDIVTRGAQLGLVGSTGRSTGPHLHYEVFRRDRVINPIQVLPLGAG